MMEAAGLFLNHSATKLEAMTQAIELCLTKLSDDQIWRRNGSNENAIGNLVLHLCGNVSQWILHGVGGVPDTRDRPLEFSESMTARDELSGKLKAVTDRSAAVIRAVPPERLVERIRPQDREVSVLEAIYNAVGHFQQHAGQIIFATKQMTGEDLAIYRP